MTLLQVMIYSFVNGLAAFFPVSVNAHRQLLPFVFNWSKPEELLWNASTAGAFLSLLIYFRHEWGSLLISFLKILFTWKKPMAVDERLSGFIFFTTLPVLIFWFYFLEDAQVLLEDVGFFWIGVIFILFGVVLRTSEKWSRETKRVIDWNWIDSLLFGFFQILHWLPGAGRQTGCFIFGFFRNYSKEAVIRFSLLSLAPIFATKVVIFFQELDFSAARPSVDMSWFQISTVVIISTVSGIFALMTLNRTFTIKGMRSVFFYRVALGGILIFLSWTEILP